MSLRIKLLGFAQLIRDGRVAPLSAIKQLTVLVALALNCNRPVGLDDLVGAVWGEDPPRSAVANLRNYASTLRQVVDDRIATLSGGYQLNLRAGERDVDEFRDLANRGRAALAAGDVVAAEKELAASLALWRGPAGQGLPINTSLGVELRSLDEERLDVFEMLVDAQLALNRFGTVVPTLRKHLYQHPLRERSWAQLILAQYRAVGAAAALATFADARDIIGKELGIEPDPMLADLHRAILSRSPELLYDPPATVLARPGHGSSRRPPAGGTSLVQTTDAPAAPVTASHRFIARVSPEPTGQA